MPAEIHCPKCDQPLTQVGEFWICPQHGQTSPRSSRGNEAQTFSATSTPLRSVINCGREPYLIVIDALDEAGEAGRNPLVEMLARNAQRLPDWLGNEPVFGTNWKF